MEDGTFTNEHISMLACENLSMQGTLACEQFKHARHVST